MKIVLLAIGRLKRGPELTLFEQYLDRFNKSGKPLGLGPLEVIELAEERSGAAAQRRRGEAERLLSKWPADAPMIAFDERGTAVSSVEIAQYLAALRARNHPKAWLVIGGPDGLDDDVRRHAGKVVALGRITLPHGLARIVVAEQLYRAATILAGHPYHRA